MPILVLLLISWGLLLAARGVSAEDLSRPVVAVSEDTVLKSPAGALLRSLVLPGWGQFYNERRTKGMTIAGVQTALFGAFLIEDRRSRGRDGSTARRDRLLLGLLGTIVYSALDAYVDAHFYGLERPVAPVTQRGGDDPGCAIFLVVRPELTSESARACVGRTSVSLFLMMRKYVDYVH